MAKNKTLKRYVTKKGEVRYFEGPKRLKNKAGQRKWIRANTTAPAQTLTKSEQRSLKALQRYNEAWKFDGVQIQPMYIALLRKLKVPISKAINKDLSTLVNKDGTKKFKEWQDVLKMIATMAKSKKKYLQFCTDVGLPNYRGRDFETFKDNKIRTIVDFLDLLNTEEFRNYNLVVYDPQGDEHKGRVAGLLAIRTFEIAVGEAMQSIAKNSAFMRFCYNYTLDIKKREVFIDLTDQKEDKDLEDYFNVATDTKAKDFITIEGKYKDVIIEIQFS
jgi:hypothetical protein